MTKCGLKHMSAGACLLIVAGGIAVAAAFWALVVFEP